MNPFYHRIYRIVRHIPKGRVATYGVVARLAGRPGAARTVGWALSALPQDNDVPWWRVINAAGRISLASDHSAVLQRALLLREGVKFAPGGAVSLGSFGWPAEAYNNVVAAQSRAASSRRSRRLNGFRT
jgi:methylated-DNA-protein-cysteine methyltransferase-like protein